MISNNNVVEACTSYLTCGILVNLDTIDWAWLGAAILLGARLAKDVPEAWDYWHTKCRKRKKLKTRRVLTKKKTK